MTTTQDTALAFILAQHTVDQSRQAQLDELHRLAAENAKLRAEQRAAQPKAKKAPPIHNGPLTTIVALGTNMPEKGSLDAEGFILAIRRAGRRLNDKGFPFTDPGQVRGDTIKAIHAFYYEIRNGVKVNIGYDVRKDYGTQDTAARALAQRSLAKRPDLGMTRDEQRSANRSLTGFVSGLPDSIAKTLANLRAQAEKVAEAMTLHEKQGNLVAAKVEHERLYGAAGIYAQIKAMGFNY